MVIPFFNGLGISLRNISAHIAEMYDTELSNTVLWQIIDRIIPRSRPSRINRWGYFWLPVLVSLQNWVLAVQ